MKQEKIDRMARSIYYSIYADGLEALVDILYEAPTALADALIKLLEEPNENLDL